MICPACQRRPLPVSGKAHACAECRRQERRIAAHIKGAATSGATVQPKWYPATSSVVR